MDDISDSKCVSIVLEMCQLKTNEEEYRIILSGVDFGFWRPDMLTADHSLPVPLHLFMVVTY